MNFLYSCEVGKWYIAHIEASPFYSTATFVIRDANNPNPKEFVHQKMIGFKMPWFKLGYFLDFFMGGDKPARQDTVAWIERLA
jgi:hypothetical protein